MMRALPGLLAAATLLGSALVLASACGDGSDTTKAASTSTSSSSTGAGGGGAGGAGGSYPAAYTETPFDATRITSDSNQPNFQRADAEIDLHDGPFASVKLVVDLASTCYPFEGWKDNPPPQGQNWPADCDAFDRNFELTIDEPADPMKGPPAIEVLRAITPFGGPLHTEVDLTDLANALPGKHHLRVVIPTWSDGAGQVSGSNGGWNVTAKIEAVPGKAPRNVLAVVPLWNGVEGPGAPVGSIAFTAPEGTTSSRIEYRATGHGGGAVATGCIGPAEEFCKRTHTLKVDDQTVFDQQLWRTDCKDLCTLTHYGPADQGFDYCLENPCGAIQSVKAPRANWCPGSVTPPVEWPASATIAPGDHTFQFDVSTIADGGIWRVSAVFFAYGD